MKIQRWHFPVALLVLGGGTSLWLQWLERSYRDEPYSLIEDGLYVGGSVAEPPPGTQAVVNLCGHRDRYAVEAELWEPICEGKTEPDLDWLKRVVRFIDDEQRASGRTTYIHCLAGMNRSGMVITAYLMSSQGWTRDRALAFVRSKRSQIQPSAALMRLLTEWEHDLRKQPRP
jgi:hypothetical protein